MRHDENTTTGLTVLDMFPQLYNCSASTDQMGREKGFLSYRIKREFGSATKIASGRC